MNDIDRSEIERLKRKQAHLEDRLSSFQILSAEIVNLGEQIRQLEERLTLGAQQGWGTEAEATSESDLGRAEADRVRWQSKVQTPLINPPPLPVQAAALEQADIQGENQGQAEMEKGGAELVYETEVTLESTTASEGVPVGSDYGSASAEEPKSFEMQVGTYWLVRVGMVMLLTALVFFGRYAYVNFVGKLGAGGKVGLMYLGSAVLLGLGGWLQRDGVKAGLKNYGQILFAGGLAAVYSTTYAAHHFVYLRVIESAIVDGLLLLGWAGVIVYIADRRKSEVLALFAIGLGYYTSAITEIGAFTLFSNLALTLAAVFFLVRKGWMTVSVVSLVATYAGYAYWRFFAQRSEVPAFWMSVGFLSAYWASFTVMSFLSREEADLTGGKRVSFLTFNNGAFFGLVLLSGLAGASGIWKLALGFGTVLIGLSAVARRRLEDEPLTSHAYLAQGLLLVTVGIVARFTGTQLILILAAQSVLLLFLGGRLRNRVMEGGAYVAAALATGWALFELGSAARAPILLGGATTFLFLVNVLQMHWRYADEESFLRPASTYFTLLALLVGGMTIWFHVDPGLRPCVLALGAVAFSGAAWGLKARELILGQLFVVVAQLLVLVEPGEGPWWSVAVVMAVTLGLIHFWKNELIEGLENAMSHLGQSIFSLALVAVIHRWLPSSLSSQEWMIAASALPLVFGAYGLVARVGWLALAGQLFVLSASWQFLIQVTDRSVSWAVALAPIGALILLARSGRWYVNRPESEEKPFTDAIATVSLMYGWLAVAMAVGWVFAYVPERERFWVLAGMALVASSWSVIAKSELLLGYSGAITAVGLGAVIFLGREESYMPNFIALILLMASQQIVRRTDETLSEKKEWHNGMILLCGGTTWILATRWLLGTSSGFYVTVGWTILAFLMLVVGLSLRERLYRWLGLAILAAAIGRAGLIDVWKLEVIFQILSFLALGIVLLLLGFFYNKYQDKIRQWL